MSSGQCTSTNKSGVYILKKNTDPYKWHATELWFSQAAQLADGLYKLPRLEGRWDAKSNDGPPHELFHFHQALVKAVPLCCVGTVEDIQRLIHIVSHWSEDGTEFFMKSRTWSEYVTMVMKRFDKLCASIFDCAHSVKWHGFHELMVVRSKVNDVLRDASHNSAPFGHGDLTLENVLKDGEGNLWIIDPNPSIFTSQYMDFGKILFSKWYHDRFKSYWLNDELTTYLHAKWSLWRQRPLGLYEEDLSSPLTHYCTRACCLSHIIRLEGYLLAWDVADTVLEFMKGMD